MSIHTSENDVTARIVSLASRVHLKRLQLPARVACEGSQSAQPHLKDGAVYRPGLPTKLDDRQNHLRDVAGPSRPTKVCARSGAERLS